MCNLGHAKGVGWVGLLCRVVPFVLLIVNLQKEGTGLAGLGYMYLKGVGVKQV